MARPTRPVPPAMYSFQPIGTCVAARTVKRINSVLPRWPWWSGWLCMMVEIVVEKMYV